MSTYILFAIAAAALILESVGLFGATPRPLDASKIGGVILTIAGVWLVIR